MRNIRVEATHNKMHRRGAMPQLVPPSDEGVNRADERSTPVSLDSPRKALCSEWSDVRNSSQAVKKEA